MKRGLRPTVIAIIVLDILVLVSCRFMILEFSNGIREMNYCMKRDHVFIHGLVIDGQGQPVSNAHVQIRNLSPEIPNCGLPEVMDMNTRESGGFDGSYAPLPEVNFEIIITADGCTTYTSDPMLFDVFTNYNYKDDPMPFYLDCDE